VFGNLHITSRQDSRGLENLNIYWLFLAMLRALPFGLEYIYLKLLYNVVEPALCFAIKFRPYTPSSNNSSREFVVVLCH
jgi:hypothetical protein